MIKDFNKVEQTPETWELNLTEYERGKWGTAVGLFKVPQTIYKRFSAAYPDVTNAGGIAIPVWKEHAFEELATTYINAIVAQNEILRTTHFDFLDADTKENLRKCIYNAIEFSCLNRQAWEIASDMSVSGSNFNLQAQAIDWTMLEAMIGKKAYNYLIVSGLDDYRWVSEKTLYAETRDGNIKVIGKANIEDIPNLADVIYV